METEFGDWTNAQLDEDLKQIINNNLGVAINDCDLSKNLIEDYSADAFDMVEIIIDCESTFDVSLPDNECEELKGSIPKLKDLIIKYLGERYKGDTNDGNA